MSLREAKRRTGTLDLNDAAELAKEVYTVEKVLDRRLAGKEVEYLVKWRGWKRSEATWEPQAHLLEYGAKQHDGFDIAYSSFIAPCQESLMRHVGSPMEPRVPRSR